MTRWRALDAKTSGELPVLRMAEHDLASICRLMRDSAAYDPTRVVVGTNAVRSGIRHNQENRTGADVHVPTHLTVRRRWGARRS